MDMRLKRDSFETAGIFGKLTSMDESCVVAATLEHAFIYGDGIKAAMAPGVYTCKRRLSPHFGYELFQIMDVPDHDFIEIHRGNFNEDSEGCVLLGSTREGGMIAKSREAFDAFMKLQAGISTFTLVVE